MPRASVGRFIAATAACVAIVGCSSGESTATNTIPKRLFIREADQLCADSYRKTQRLNAPSLPPQARSELDRVAAFFHVQVVIGSRELNRIRALGIAVPDAAAQARNLDTADRMVAHMRSAARHARRGDLAGTRSHYREVQSYSQRATELAEQFGYRVCGQGGIHRRLNR